jgi:hypothetical protein
MITHDQTRSFLLKYAEDRFAALDVGHSGFLPIVTVRGFVKSVVQGSDAAVSEAISQFVAAAEAAARDVAPEAVVVSGVVEVRKEPFSAGVLNSPLVSERVSRVSSRVVCGGTVPQAKLSPRQPVSMP